MIDFFEKGYLLLTIIKIGGQLMNMYAHQNDLPRLPLPALEESSRKLLEWSAIFLSEQELIHTQEALQAFTESSGPGPTLQKKLEQMAQNPDIPNWLENFWADTYLCNQSPLPTSSNVTFILDKNESVKNLSTAEFLASLIYQILPFHQEILNKSLAVDFQGKYPLCMSQYTTLLATTRIPGVTRDSLLTDPISRHIIFIHKGSYHRIFVLKENREKVDASTLLHQFQNILDAPSQQKTMVPGVLTSLPRPKWSEFRTHLINLSLENKHHLEAIESALAVFIVDDDYPKDESQLFKDFFFSNPFNRWYDKSLQFILNKNGDLGINYEHSGVDGTTLGRLVGYLYKHMAPIKKEAVINNQITASHPSELSFVLDEVLKKEMQEALNLNQQSNEDFVFQVLSFTDFGKEKIKSLGISPDSFIQIGIQMAQHKAFGKAFNVYESVMTKQFLHGRTEAMRPVTHASLEFLRLPCIETLKTASLKHVERINECKNGQGIDRHFFGLKKMHQQMFPEQPLPAIFTSPGYQVITANTYSTSTSSSLGMRYAGYGPSTKEGFAVRYLIFNDKINFIVSSRKKKSSVLKQYRRLLKESLKEMIGILEST